MKALKKNHFLLLLILSGIIIFISIPSCQNSEDIRFRKYMSIGKQIYQQRCLHCHGENGKGLGKLYPPLDSADYLIEQKHRIACFIQNGQVGKIIVNGQDYNQVMPANPDLLEDDIAHVMTYILNAWSNNEGLVDKSYVEKSLGLCED